MFSPHTIVVNKPWLYVIRHERADYNAAGAPLAERLNLLRYEITVRPGRLRLTINRDGRLALALANFNWWLWRRALTARRRRHQQFD